ncbi:hypothetical protein TW81_03615 [Vibrio galatheae]|uniref:Uncharacterized protein n=1 Tax=Vibrio galatheae TaxID=579748 RepID=A0A0F4NRA8_9VIBR|nr:DUF3820 family protein [Vibrio galatheae]KJY84626.1 hypothetical protein TW81_03615 [Vibrio galatheae]
MDRNSELSKGVLTGHLSDELDACCELCPISRRQRYCFWFDKKGFPDGELGELLKLCLALKIEGLDSVVKPQIMMLEV